MKGREAGGLRLRDDARGYRKAVSACRKFVDMGMTENAVAALRALMDALEDPSSGMSVREAVREGGVAAEHCAHDGHAYDVSFGAAARLLASLTNTEGDDALE